MFNGIMVCITGYNENKDDVLLLHAHRSMRSSSNRHSISTIQIPPYVYFFNDITPYYLQ